MLNELIAIVSAGVGLFICYVLWVIKKIFHIIKTISRLDVDMLPKDGVFPKFAKNSTGKKVKINSKQAKFATQFDLKEVWD